MHEYSDDLLILTNTREHLNTLTDGFEEFMKYAHIKFNLKQGKMLVHNPDKKEVISVQLSDAKKVYSNV
jgi:hypothetical protein